MIYPLFCLDLLTKCFILLGTAKLKQAFPNCKSMIATSSGAKADITFGDGDQIQFGSRYVSVISTPGHTDVSIDTETNEVQINNN